jgi:hypothetical protein
MFEIQTATNEQAGRDLRMERRRRAVLQIFCVLLCELQPHSRQSQRCNQALDL